jgi:hypothetical protein
LTRGAEVKSLISLNKALGGGWSLPETEAPDRADASASDGDSPETNE